MSRIIPVPKPNEKITRSSVELPDALWEALEKIAKETLDPNSGKRLYTRNQVIELMLRWALKEYDEERRAAKK